MDSVYWDQMAVHGNEFKRKDCLQGSNYFKICFTSEVVEE